MSADALPPPPPPDDPKVIFPLGWPDIALILSVAGLIVLLVCGR